MLKQIFKTFLLLFLVLMVVISVFIFMPQKARALFGLGNPFGGMVLNTLYCTASHNNWIIVGPPRPGSFMQDAGTILYRRYQPYTGHWVLGLADAFEPCLMLVCTPVGCFPVPVGGGSRIRMMGTS